MAAAAAPAVDDLADGLDATAEDRAQARAAKASVAKFWETLLDEKGALREHSFGGGWEKAAPGTSAVAGAGGGAAQPRPEAAHGGANGATAEAGIVRRAMVRHAQLVLDMTDSARQPDYRPRRFEFAVEAAGRFAERFLAENPLAELGLCVLRGGTSEVAAPLVSSSKDFEEHLLRAAAGGPRGRASLVSGLLRATAGLEDTPGYGTREVLVLFASLSNWDPVETPIEGVLAPLQEKRIRVSVVSMSPEMHVLRRVCTQTGGSYAVALDGSHFEELLSGHVPAPTCGPRALAPKLIRMGFPRQVFEVAGLAACSCHLRLQSQLFVCPQCHARVCKVPSRCHACQLPLASAPLIARSYRHLLPLPPFVPAGEVDAGAEGREARCCGCQLLGPWSRACPACGGRFCEACDEFTHDALQQCPGCLEAGKGPAGA